MQNWKHICQILQYIPVLNSFFISGDFLGVPQEAYLLPQSGVQSIYPHTTSINVYVADQEEYKSMMLYPIISPNIIAQDNDQDSFPMKREN